MPPKSSLSPIASSTKLPKSTSLKSSSPKSTSLKSSSPKSTSPKSSSPKSSSPKSTILKQQVLSRMSNMDIDIQRKIFNKFLDITKEDNISDGIYKYYNYNNNISIFVYDDTFIYKFTTFEYDYDNDVLTDIEKEDNINIIISMCYDYKTNKIMIISNILYELNNIIIKGLSENHKYDKVVKEIFIKFIEKIYKWLKYNNYDVNLIANIIHYINNEYIVKITIKNISKFIKAIEKETIVYNPKKSTKRVIPVLISSQILSYREQQLKEAKLKLQKSFYKYITNDKTNYIIFNENIGDYYLNYLYKDQEGRIDLYIYSNIILVSDITKKKELTKMMIDKINDKIKKSNRNTIIIINNNIIKYYNNK